MAAFAVVVNDVVLRCCGMLRYPRPRVGSYSSTAKYQTTGVRHPPPLILHNYCCFGCCSVRSACSAAFFSWYSCPPYVVFNLSNFFSRPPTFGLVVWAVRQGFTPAMLEAYNLYRLSLLQSLKRWDLFRRPGSLADVARDIKQLRR